MREPCPTEANRSIKPQSHQDRKEIHQAPVVIKKIHACQSANEERPVPYKNVEEVERFEHGNRVDRKLHDGAVSVALLVNGRARETRLLHATAALLEVFQTLPGLGESLC
jgi:hypothetical protein